jgi:signal transduction histidine kinase
VREEERQQIARHIHDDLGQSLTALRFDVAWLKKRTSDLIILDRLDDMATLIRQANQTVQRICTELRPSLLDDLGLEAALEWQLTEFRRRTGISVTANVKGFTCCNGERAAHLFRIFQEALTNIIRHADATEVTIFSGVKAHHCYMKIADNGCGINTRAGRNKSAFGLLGIRERAALLGGTARISRRRAGGTQVTVRIPCCKGLGQPAQQESS